MDLYQDHILEHYKDPQNYGLLSQATHTRKEFNPTCGDEFTFSVLVDAAGVITDVGFEGSGCAISTASASLVTEAIRGMKLADVLTLQPQFVLDLLGVEILPIRLKCALLPLQGVTRITQSKPQLTT